MSRDPGNDIELAIAKGDDQNLVKFSREQRAKGLLICGVPGSGKTKLMEFMLRQDLRLWHTSRCGTLLIDSQGSMYDDVIEYMAACRLDRIPVIPIDLRRGDFVVSFDVLRHQMDGDPAVHIRSKIDSLLHSFEQRDAQATPRLALWLEGILFSLYENERPLVDALHIISDPLIRKELTRNLEHVVAQATWKTARHLREERFQEMVESVANRLRKFLSAKLIRAMLSQKGASLDMLQAINDGAIVLASLATAKGLVTSEDAKTIGNLLLSEAWQAVQTRGATRRVKPFYVYADEAQSYINPSMIDTLDQARKFGLHFTFGMQFPSQFKRNGEIGQMIFDSLMGNCRSKIVFQQGHPEDLEMLALWIARHAIDPNLIKDEIYSPKVFAQEIIYLPSYSSGTTNGVGGGSESSVTKGENHSVSENWSHTNSESFSTTDSTTVSTGESAARSTNEGHTRSESLTRSSHEDFSLGQSIGDGTSNGINNSRAITRSDSEAENWSEGSSHSRGRSFQNGKNRSLGQAFRRPSDEDEKEIDNYLDGQLDAGKKEMLRRQRGSQITLGEGRAEASTESDGIASSKSAGGSRSRSNAFMASEGTSVSHQQMKTRSNSRAVGNALAMGAGDARTQSVSLAEASNLTTSEGQSETAGISSSDTHGGSETFGTSTARTRGQNSSWSRASSATTSYVPVVWQHLKWDVSSRTFMSIEEQVFNWTKYIDGQPDRHCLARLAGVPMPIPLITATVKQVRASEQWVQSWIAKKLAALPFVLSGNESAARVAAQDQELLSLVYRRNEEREPRSYRRRIKSD